MRSLLCAATSGSARNHVPVAIPSVQQMLIVVGVVNAAKGISATQTERVLRLKTAWPKPSTSSVPIRRSGGIAPTTALNSVTTT